MLFPGEDADEMLAPDRVADLLRHHIADPTAVEVVRARVYTHHSRIAARFVDGRIALAGDAAHLMPPWAGQGMNTGIRDVTNLCWKLAAIVQDQVDHSLLHTYDRERRPHARAMIDLSTTLGRILSPTRRSLANARDWVLRAASLAPAVKQWVLEMRFKPVPHYQSGFVAPEDSGARLPSVGRMFVQPLVETVAGAHSRLDDVLGPWFAVIGFECDPLAKLSDAELAAVRIFRPRILKILESRAGHGHHQQPCVDRDTIVVEDVHNQLRPWFQARGRNVVIVRPDRYVAAMTTADALGPVITHLTGQFAGGQRLPGQRG
jgi:3-(3-hydroxy-phenyl)propionate hydroxylase